MKQSSKLYKPHPLIQTLKNNQVTQVISEGLAMICHNKPEFPIKYLSQFLLNYVHTKKETQNLRDIREHKESIINDQSKHQIQQKSKEVEVEKEKRKVEHRIVEFKKQIENQQDFQRFFKKFCTWIQQTFQLGAMYVGQLRHPRKEVEQTNLNQQAHLDTQKEKRLQYISSSQNQQHIIVGQSLVMDCLTASLFEKKQQIPVQDEADDKEKEPSNFIYIPNVIKDQRIRYLRFPKLGSYFAVPMINKSYLNQNSFDLGFQKTLTYNKNKQEIQKQMERKQEEFKEAYQQKVRNEADEKELQQMEQRFQQQKISMTPEQIEIPFEQNLFVVCSDTMGLDSEIPQRTRKEIINYVSLLNSAWQKKQLDKIKQDIDNQIKYTQLFEGNLQETIQRVIQNDQKQPDQISQLERFRNNQKQYQYELDSLKLEKIKQTLVDQKYLVYFNTLTSMNVLRYQPIMQMALYLIGYKKSEINIPGTNLLNWNKVRLTICNQNMIDRLVEYTHRGSKPEKVQLYAKWSLLLTVLEKFDYTAVLTYNLFYGSLLKYLLTTGRLRKIDSQIRQQKLKILRAARLQKIGQNQRIQQQKQRVKQQKIAALAEQQQEENPNNEQAQQFDQQAWQVQYNQEHPLLEIQDQYQDQIDDDLEEQEQEVEAQQPS